MILRLKVSIIDNFNLHRKRFDLFEKSPYLSLANLKLKENFISFILYH